MRELWIKKTIYRRYLIEDNEIDEVKAILETNAETSIELIGDAYDNNRDVEYDNEITILPIEYSINKF